MKLDEFIEVYRNGGEMGALLCIDELECSFFSLVHAIPKLSSMFRMRAKDLDYLFQYDPKGEGTYNFSKLTPDDYATLLIKYPHYSEGVNWAKMSEDLWTNLIQYQPQFIPNFDLKKCKYYRSIEDILRYQPHLVDECNLDIVVPHSISRILQNNPQLIDKFDITKFDSGDISSLLKKQPQFITKCKLSTLTGSSIKSLLRVHPHLHPFVDLTKLTPMMIKTVLKHQPSLSIQLTGR
jgi:hypothetical protein